MQIMDKLTTEQKAKRYDEALKYAKIYYTSGDEDMKMMMKTCFPALVEESEGEKIRNEIIAFVEQSIHRGGGTPIPQEQEDRWIAWLEKQGEQKPTDEELKKLLQAEYEKGRTKALEEIPKEDATKQKPAEWSEEDEKMFNSALWHVKNSCGNQGKTSGEYEVYNWLKSIKDRCLPQPKQEWSEEDELAIKGLMECIDTGDCEATSKVFLINWLKSLRHQKQWKPSEEQMDALNMAIGEANSVDTAAGDVAAEVLTSLYKQLKAL